MTELYNLYTRQNEFVHLSLKRYSKQVVTDYLSIYLWYIYTCISEMVVIRLIKQFSGPIEWHYLMDYPENIYIVGIDWVVLK